MLSIEEKRNIWLKSFEDNKELIEKTVPENIEKYRKSNCKIRLIDGSGKPLKNKPVKVVQKSHFFKYGANIFMLDEFQNEEDNIKYRKMFKEYFNLATVPFYWDSLEPEKGKPRFDKASSKIYRRPAPDLCIEYCEENGITPKLHCLVYDKFIPKWLPRDDMEKMEKYYEERIRQIAKRYTGKMFEFEVINETLCEPGWGYKSVISKKRDVVEWAFNLARKYLPDETLVINEGNPIIPASKNGYRSNYFMQIEKCLLSGASIDKIGLQHHVFTGALAQNEADYEKSVKNQYDSVNPKNLIKGLSVFSSLNLPMEISEVTLPTFGETAEDEDLQAEILKNVFSLWFSVPEIDTVVYWNTVDGYAYYRPANDISGDGFWNENQCRGGLFHHDLTPKKSALMLKKLFNEIWHTEFEAMTDENGFIEFRGYFGEYSAIAGNSGFSFEIQKNKDNIYYINI